MDCFDHKVPVNSKERTRSCDKKKNLEIMYSRSLAQLFEGSDVLEKLKEHKISEIKLVNLTTSDIRDLPFLASE